MADLSHSLLVAVACLGFCAPLCHALDPKAALTDYGVTQWSGTESSPALAITAITQSSDGYLWLGTHEGLLRFDGIKFVNYSSANSKLPDNDVSAVLANADGTLWLGFRSGRVCRRADTGFTCFGQEAGLSNYEVRGLARDGQGTLWVASVGGGLRKLEHEKLFRAADETGMRFKTRFAPRQTRAETFGSPVSMRAW